MSPILLLSDYYLRKLIVFVLNYFDFCPSDFFFLLFLVSFCHLPGMIAITDISLLKALRLLHS